VTKTIIFDIGGVVVRSDFRAIYSGFAKRIGLASEIVVNYHKDHLDALLLGDIDLNEFWQDFRETGGNPNLDYSSIWFEEAIKNRGMNVELLAIIERLKRKYSVGALTNLTASRLMVDEKTGLYSHFDYAVLSCREHIKKPDPKFFQLALSRASAKPEEAVFVDDKESLTGSAEGIGMKSIIYSYPDNATLLEKLRELGVSI
jgi:epoxide hydrolase-like predicted phosphatase